MGNSPTTINATNNVEPDRRTSQKDAKKIAPNSEESRVFFLLCLIHRTWNVVVDPISRRWVNLFKRKIWKRFFPSRLDLFFTFYLLRYFLRKEIGVRSKAFNFRGMNQWTFFNFKYFIIYFNLILDVRSSMNQLAYCTGCTYIWSQVCNWSPCPLFMVLSNFKIKTKQ